MSYLINLVILRNLIIWYHLSFELFNNSNLQLGPSHGKCYFKKWVTTDKKLSPFKEGRPPESAALDQQCSCSGCIIDQAVGCEWLLSSSLWLRTGCEISAATTSALFPLQLDAIYSPNPDLPSGKRKKKDTRTQEKKYSQPFRALWIKHSELKVPLKLESCR